MNRFFELTNDFKFSYSVQNLNEITTENYLNAIEKTTKIVYEDCLKSESNKIGLCLSGSDSELIAHFLHKNKIPTEYFFLNIAGINSKELELCKKISEKYNTKLNVIYINKDDLLRKIIYENFQITYVCWPTYVTLPTLIKYIPKNYYIVLGEGDLEKGWNRYKKIYEEKIKSHDDNFFYIPMHLTEISYLLSLSHFEKKGEGNFYSRCFDNWYHILNDEDLITDGICVFDPKTKIISKIIRDLNLISPLKTMNYDDNAEKNMLGHNIINKLKKYGKKIENWSPTIGDIVKIEKKVLKK